MKIPNIVWVLIFAALIAVVAYFGFFKRQDGEGIINPCGEAATIDNATATNTATNVHNAFQSNPATDPDNSIRYGALRQLEELTDANLCRVANRYLFEYNRSRLIDLLRNEYIAGIGFFGLNETDELRDKIVNRLSQLGL